MSETVWVHYGDNDQIDGVFANEQSFPVVEKPADDPEVVAFLDRVNNPPPPPPSTQDQVLFDHENRVRALEGQPPLSLADFTKAMKA